MLLVAAGGFCLILGTLGIVLPLLPTTPFVLLALWCFSRSSERFHSWLLNHRYFGQVLSDWEQHRGLTTVHKRRAYLVVVVSFSFSIYMVPVLWVKLLMVGIGLVVIWHIHQMNTVPVRKLSGEND